MFGLSWHFWLYLSIWIIALRYVPSWIKAILIKMDLVSDDPSTTMITFHDGPLDEKIEAVDNAQPFYVAPYIPTDEEERGEPIGHFKGQTIYGHKLAYYQQITEDEYFYVRDITEAEAAQVMMTGKLPSIDDNG